MRTEDDLYTALAGREELAPDPDRVLAGARVAAVAYRRRRVAVGVGAIAAAAVTAIAAVVTVPGMLRDGASGPPADVPEVPKPRPPLAFTIQPATVDGFEIHPFSVNADYQMARIMRSAQQAPVADLIVYEPNADASPDSTPVRRWEYVPNGFAEIHSETDSPLDEATLDQLMDALRFTAPYSARLPYRLDYLPAGVAPYDVAQDTARAGAFGSAVAMENPGNPSAPPTVDIAVGEFSLDDFGWDPEPTTIAGRPAQCGDVPDGHHCAVELEEFTMEIGIANISQDDLARIVAGLQPATWDDPTTWYELDDAIPGD